MKWDNGVLGDFDGNRYADLHVSSWPREILEKCDYVLVNGVKFVSAKKLHEERVRRLNE